MYKIEKKDFGYIPKTIEFSRFGFYNSLSDSPFDAALPGHGAQRRAAQRFSIQVVYKLTFGGTIDQEEMERWLADSKRALVSAPVAFYVFVDMRNVKSFADGAREAIIKGQRFYKHMGMLRSVVIVANEAIKKQFIQIARETGIYDWERYLDTNSCPDWEVHGIAWLVNARDPDKTC